MPKSYSAFVEYLRAGKQEFDPGRPLANNTRVYRHGGTEAVIVVRFHRTEVIRFHPNGDIDINTGGWFTRTTAERICDYSPIKMFRHRWARGDDNVVWCVTREKGMPWYRIKEDPDAYYSKVYIIGSGHPGNIRFFAKPKNKRPRSWLDIRGADHGVIMPTLQEFLADLAATKTRAKVEAKKYTERRRLVRRHIDWMVKHKLLRDAAAYLENLNVLYGPTLVDAIDRQQAIELEAERQEVVRIHGREERVIQL